MNKRREAGFSAIEGLLAICIVSVFVLGIWVALAWGAAYFLEKWTQQTVPVGAFWAGVLSLPAVVAAYIWFNNRPIKRPNKNRTKN